MSGYETKANASATYETIEGAANTYISKTAAPGYDDILTKTSASSTYITSSAANSALGNKADKSSLGTQVTYSLSGTTLTITTK